MNLRPLIVPVFIPHAGCSHRCAFCNQSLVSGQPAAHPDLDHGLAFIPEFLRFGNRRQGPVQIAFFGGNFLGLSRERVRRLLAIAVEWVNQGNLDGIRFSTRPDTIHSQTIDLIADFPVRCVELGVQSMDDEVLGQSCRGHTAADTTAAVQCLKAGGYAVGVQLMVGLPGDDEQRLLETAQRIADLKPAFVRIYPTLVLEGSLLADWYRDGRYRPLALDEAVELSMKLYRFMRRHAIPVIRTGLQPTEDLANGRGVVAGPFHPAFGELVQSACFLSAIRDALRQLPPLKESIDLRVNPRNVSRARGQHNANCMALRQEFGFSEVRVTADSGLDEEMVALPDGLLVDVYAPNDD
jgi:histone acetyltransferase (RNA polymerase elongator complex component)